MQTDTDPTGVPLMNRRSVRNTIRTLRRHGVSLLPTDSVIEISAPNGTQATIPIPRRGIATSIRRAAADLLAGRVPVNAITAPHSDLRHDLEYEPTVPAPSLQHSEEATGPGPETPAAVEPGSGEDIYNRLLAGETVAGIAAELQISPAAVRGRKQRYERSLGDNSST